MNNKLIKFLVGLSANRETTCFTNDSSREKRKLNRVVNGIGGTSVNFALQAETLGAKVHLMATVGKDFEATILELEIRNRLKGQFTALPCREGTSFAHVVIETNGVNKRTLDSYKSEYLNLPLSEVKKLVSQEGHDAVVMTGIMLEEAPLVQTAFASSTALRILNPRAELTGNKNLFEAVLRNTDVLCMNEKEYFVFSGKSRVTKTVLNQLHSLGAKLILVTRGSEGIVVSERRDDLVQIPACLLGDEIDATGAGDAFLASFLTQLCAGKSAIDAAKFGSFVAGIAVTKVGGSNTVTAADMEVFGNRRR